MTASLARHLRIGPRRFYTPFTLVEHRRNRRIIWSFSVISPAPVTGLPQTGDSRATDPLGHLGAQERAVLFVLAEDAGKVVSRRELARRIGIENLSERRCDSILVGVRRVLGPDAIRTVRSRGWMLQPATEAFLKEIASRT
jgi:DNA-binding winged helix-turn-helix (wHTH) protein